MPSNKIFTEFLFTIYKHGSRLLPEVLWTLIAQYGITPGRVARTVNIKGLSFHSFGQNQIILKHENSIDWEVIDIITMERTRFWLGEEYADHQPVQIVTNKFNEAFILLNDSTVIIVNTYSFFDYDSLENPHDWKMIFIAKLKLLFPPLRMQQRGRKSQSHVVVCGDGDCCSFSWEGKKLDLTVVPTKTIPSLFTADLDYQNFCIRVTHKNTNTAMLVVESITSDNKMLLYKLFSTGHFVTLVSKKFMFVWEF
jgi:hypothetical protein